MRRRTANDGAIITYVCRQQHNGGVPLSELQHNVDRRIKRSHLQAISGMTEGADGWHYADEHGGINGGQWHANSVAARGVGEMTRPGMTRSSLTPLSGIGGRIGRLGN